VTQKNILPLVLRLVTPILQQLWSSYVMSSSTVSLVPARASLSQRPPQPPAPVEATVIVRVSQGGQLDLLMRADPMMAIVMVALVAFGTVGIALYALQLAIKKSMDRSSN
jgi:hypothetical protein